MLWASVVGAHFNTLVGAYKKRWRGKPRACLTHPPTPTRAGPGKGNSASLLCSPPTLPCPPKPCGRNGCWGWRIQKAVARQAARLFVPTPAPLASRQPFRRLQAATCRPACQPSLKAVARQAARLFVPTPAPLASRQPFRRLQAATCRPACQPSLKAVARQAARLFIFYKAEQARLQFGLDTFYFYLV